MAADGPPQIIDGRFETLALLGEGGMGVVYRALHRDMNRQVALKSDRQWLSTSLTHCQFIPATKTSQLSD